jgi:hypothetical protein
VSDPVDLAEQLQTAVHMFGDLDDALRTTMLVCDTCQWSMAISGPRVWPCPFHRGVLLGVDLGRDT